ncbi:MAG TPA: alpha/beta fold hydrolase [Actinomycetes bacterium]|nr:alpha/beta fold hydrolase [Actinomycetes bacterium]
MRRMVRSNGRDGSDIATPLPRPVRLLTRDGVRIEAAYEAGIGASASDGLAIVVAHGFTGGWRQLAVRRVTRWLRSYAAVLSFDFRGHGRSAGLSTVGDREILDVDAVVRWARLLGYPRVASVGWSMGAAVAVRHAAIERTVDAVVSVSGPAHWYYRGTRPTARAHWAFERPHGRTLLRYGYRTRVDARHWDASRPETWPITPREAAVKIAPIPYLVVHGDRDAYFPPYHGRQLAAPGSEFWEERGFGHAEGAASRDLVDRIGAWVVGHT